jgi:hypothetical protein
VEVVAKITQRLLKMNMFLIKLLLKMILQCSKFANQ